MVRKLHCISCGKDYDEGVRYQCDCSGLLEVRYDLDGAGFDLERARNRRLGVWRYRELLPVEKNVSLNEGGTSLYKCDRLGRKFGIKNLWVKNEGENPTGSFKDRGMTVGVSKAVEFKVKAVACASTGNTSASLAAYAARSGITCMVIIPAGKIAYGKLSQALIYGAKVLAIKGNFDDALEMVMDACDKYGFYLLNSINPYRLEGQKTIAFEIFDQLDGVPDRVVLPVGNAGNISAIWKGFSEYIDLGIISQLPKMTGIQAEGAMPMVELFKENLDVLKPVKNPETIASAIRIGSPVSWLKAIRAIRDSKGLAESVTDPEILEAQKLLARKEGIFVEPASAASIAGLIKLIEQEDIDKDETIVCITTGHGLKDPDVAVDSCKDELIEVKNLEELDGVLRDI
ncbi:MAG: threonine synthase [Candidatus Altiarchaeales archaeon WOR_SM1_86-2]|nr:MAG: threonine synthase [Candidatus Altiarchaeales archaeon WOR_SM1_86-2]